MPSVVVLWKHLDLSKVQHKMDQRKMDQRKMEMDQRECNHDILFDSLYIQTPVLVFDHFGLSNDFIYFTSLPEDFMRCLHTKVENYIMHMLYHTYHAVPNKELLEHMFIPNIRYNSNDASNPFFIVSCGSYTTMWNKHREMISKSNFYKGVSAKCILKLERVRIRPSSWSIVWKCVQMSTAPFQEESSDDEQHEYEQYEYEQHIFLSSCMD